MANIPKEIAEFLNLPNPKQYTGHSFRRTSTTLLSNSGANMQSIQDHGGWKSTTVAKKYCADSDMEKFKRARAITKSIREKYAFYKRQPKTSDAISSKHKQNVHPLKTSNLINFGASTSKDQIYLPDDISQQFNEEFSSDEDTKIPEDLSQQYFEDFSDSENIMETNTTQQSENNSDTSENYWEEDSLPSEIAPKLVEGLVSPQNNNDSIEILHNQLAPKSKPENTISENSNFIKTKHPQEKSVSNENNNRIINYNNCTFNYNKD